MQQKACMPTKSDTQQDSDRQDASQNFPLMHPNLNVQQHIDLYCGSLTVHTKRAVPKMELVKGIHMQLGKCFWPILQVKESVRGEVRQKVKGHNPQTVHLQLFRTVQVPKEIHAQKLISILQAKFTWCSEQHEIEIEVVQQPGGLMHLSAKLVVEGLIPAWVKFVQINLSPFNIGDCISLVACMTT